MSQAGQDESKHVLRAFTIEHELLEKEIAALAAYYQELREGEELLKGHESWVSGISEVLKNIERHQVALNKQLLQNTERSGSLYESDGRTAIATINELKKWLEILKKIRDKMNRMYAEENSQRAREVDDSWKSIGFLKETINYCEATINAFKSKWPNQFKEV
ncbi:MAG: hypothetical protein AABX32_06220 [Nanoarchaeota archaeon]